MAFIEGDPSMIAKDPFTREHALRESATLFEELYISAGFSTEQAKEVARNVAHRQNSVSAVHVIEAGANIASVPGQDPAEARASTKPWSTSEDKQFTRDLHVTKQEQGIEPTKTIYRAPTIYRGSLNNPLT